MKLLVIRHGESEADLLGVHEGRADFDLTERGHQQAASMAGFVKENFEISAIYCSPLKRAYQTAAHLSQEVGIPPIVEEKLMEFNNGRIAGLPKAAAQERYPFVRDLPVHAAVYGQESALEFRFRADYMLSKIVSETAPDAAAAVITHGGMINQLYRSFLRLPVDSEVSFKTGDTGIHIWYLDEKHRCIAAANYTAHAKGL